MRPAAVSVWRRTRARFTHSIKLRIVLVFLLLAAALALVFFATGQRAFSVGWREAARPILSDYVDRLVTDITDGSGSPKQDRALALVGRLPLTVNISGPQVNWSSHPTQASTGWHGGERAGRSEWRGLLQRQTADGHRIEFGINVEAIERRPRMIGPALAVLLALTLLAWLYVRHLLKPLDAIGAGARRFGAGDFSQAIAVRGRHGTDELGELAQTLNTMGQDIHQMLEAKRTLLLAISHELRSPITRARLNTELLPESDDIRPQRAALLRDLQEMTSLIADLLESERLASRHSALQRETVALQPLAQEVVAEVMAHHPPATDKRPGIALLIAADLPLLALDPVRIRLLLRNLLSNAVRHSADAPMPPELHLRREGNAVCIEVRDHGPGVPDDQLLRLGQAFYRTDSARSRAQGGVGLGLYLCRLIAQAHGGTLELSNARPGFRALVRLPVSAARN